MNRVFGLETEYGITVNGAETVDVVAESIELVRRYTDHGAHMKWDYELEDPHLDARGFRAKALMQDTDESAYYEIDKNRPLSFEEIKSDLVLSNGARFYNDHAHPEYSTPECTTIREIVLQDKAGERILAECARRRNKVLPLGFEAKLYKNNTDFVGHSYGCHDNYLMQRDVPWDRIVGEVVPFLVTRQIYAGAGKMGVEGEDAAGTPGVYQVAQRSDFFSVLCSIDTMNRRPLVNTRDEPHADAEAYRRFHVIVGDANMSEFATALKMGVTSLVLELIETGHSPQLELANPIEATKSISRDASYSWIVELRDGRKISAIDIQRLYLAAAKKHCAKNGDAPWLQSIDLEYHNVTLERGLYYELMREGQMRRIVTEEEIKRAIFQPPDTTRAFFRGRAVAKFNREIESIQWDELTFRSNGTTRTVTLAHPSHDAWLDRANAAIR